MDENKTTSIKEIKSGQVMKNALYQLESVELIKRYTIWLIASMVVYILWNLNLSIAPVLLLLLIIIFHHEREKQIKKQTLTGSSISNEKKMVEAYFNGDTIPSWILFPDKDRAEWINTITEQMWPNLGAFVRDMMYGWIEPEVKKALEEYGISGFCFQQIALGNIPPRITGIKVYDKKVARNQIILDLDFSFTSDCDITISVKGLNVGVKDVKLQGTFRLELKPLITEAPLFATAEAYLLSTPEFDFSLCGMANLLDLTGISSLLHQIISEIIRKLLVYPNRVRLFERN